MKRYVRVYLLLLRMNFSHLLAYRSNFVNSMLGSMTWGIFSFVSMTLLTLKVDTVYGWKREEILMLTGAYGILIGIFHSTFSKNFERLTLLINRGALDSILLKPLDSQFLVSFWLFNYPGLFRVFAGIIFILYLIVHFSLSIPLVGVLLFPFFLIAGLILLYSIWFIVGTTVFWFTRLTNLVELMYSISGTSRFPREIFEQLTWFVFLLVLPISFIVITPVRVFLGDVHGTEIIGLFVSTGTLFTFSRLFWKHALRSYSSASS